MNNQQHLHYLQQAYQLAKQAEEKGEVPVAAVIVYHDTVIASGFNQCIQANDPTAHAEIVALRNAAEKLKNYRLTDCSVFVTLEPCLMCAAAMLHARVKEVIFGAYDAKVGAVCSAFEVFNHPNINHTVSWKGGVLEAECTQLLKSFFQQRR